MHDDRAALDVAQEVQAQAFALGSAGDQAGNVSHRVARVAGRHDAQVWHERGERVVGDLRARRTHGGNQRRLASRRKADEGHVGHGLELQDNVAFLARLAQQSEARGLACLRRERRVAQAAATTLGDHEARARARQVG